MVGAENLIGVGLKQMDLKESESSQGIVNHKKEWWLYENVGVKAFCFVFFLR